MVSAVPYTPTTTTLTVLDQVAGSVTTPTYPIPTITGVTKVVPYINRDLHPTNTGIKTTLATTLPTSLPTTTLGSGNSSLYIPAVNNNNSMYLVAGGIALVAFILLSKTKR